MTAHYELDAAGDIHEVTAAGETDEARQVGKAQVAMSAGPAAPKRPFDEIAWWSRQLGRPLSVD